MKTKKSWVLIPAAVLLVAVICLCITAFASSPSSAEEDRKLSAVKDAYSALASDKEASVIRDDSVFEEAFEAKLFSVKSEGYVYLFDDATLAPKAILLTEKAKADPAEAIASESEATAFAERVMAALFPDYEAGDYAIKVSSCAENYNPTYSVEFLEKINENLYGGKKVAIIVTGEGVLESVVCVQGDTAVTDAARMIDEQTAVGIAYEAISARAGELMLAEAASEKSPEKTGTEIIMTDSGKAAEEAKSEPYRIFTADTKGHEVSTYREAADGTTVWVVEIGNVATNRIWTLGFMVRLDAVTGEVLSVDNTR